MSKRRGLDDSLPDSSSGDGGQAAKASLEAMDSATRGLPPNLPECPSGKSFLELVPYIYDYCDAVAKTKPNVREIDVDVPLPNGKPFRLAPHRLSKDGNSMVDKIELGKSGVLKCHYDVIDGKITFDKSAIELHSMVAPWLGSKRRPFYLDRDQSSKRTDMIFDNPTPGWLRERLKSDPRDVIVKDLSEEAGSPVANDTQIAKKAKK